VFGSAATMAVAAGIGLGLWSLGGRGRQREISADQRRSTDLSAITYAIQQWYNTEKNLPADLDAARRYSPGLNLRDPITNAPYEYRSLGDTQYELCATFALDGGADPSFRLQHATFGSHRAGKQCFDLDARRTSGYR
jgi:hypothetical protein